MKHSYTPSLARTLTVAGTLFLLGAACLDAVAEPPLGTGVNYQGFIQKMGLPVNGNTDFQFTLFQGPNAGDPQVGPGPITLVNQSVVQGLFTVTLDFGNVYDGQQRWLQIAVRNPAGSGAYTTLTPRQQLTAVPYAMGLRLPFAGAGTSLSPALSVTNTSCGSAGLFTQSDAPSCNPSEPALAAVTEATDVGATALEAAVVSDSAGSGSVAVRGINYGTSGDCFKDPVQRYGVWGTADDCQGTGVFGTSVLGIGVRGSSQNGLAAAFDGRTSFGGDVTVFADRITLHDPQNPTKFLALRTDGNLLDIESDNTIYIHGTPYLVLQPFSGSVGIGIQTPNYLLHCDGSAGKPGGGSWSNASDRRLKKNIRDLAGVLDQLLSLRGVAFEYKDPQSIHELPGQQIGMIAQEVEQVYPQWVEENSQGFKTVTYRGFEALTVEALREMRNEKHRDIASVRAENAELRSRLETLEALVSEMVVRQGTGAP